MHRPGAIEDAIRVAVAGAGGRMGGMVVTAVSSAPDLVVVAEVEAGDDLATTLAASEAQVLVDFTVPAVGGIHLETAIASGVHPVIGTTGIDPACLERATEGARERGIGGVVAPNFALGAVMMIELARRAAPHWDAVEILEAHHPAKQDAPSGTALRTREAIAGVRSDSGEIPIHSVRLPGFVASQEIWFGGAGERLSIRHDTLDRTCFAPGILLAIRSAPTLRELVLDLAPLLFDDRSDRDHTS